MPACLFNNWLCSRHRHQNSYQEKSVRLTLLIKPVWNFNAHPIFNRWPTQSAQANAVKRKLNPPDVRDTQQALIILRSVPPSFGAWKISEMSPPDSLNGEERRERFNWSFRMTEWALWALCKNSIHNAGDDSTASVRQQALVLSLCLWCLRAASLH